MKIRLLIILCVCFLSSTIEAQESRITTENASSLQPLYTVGSALPGQLAFSPDDRYLIASTTDETYVYGTNDLQAAPRILPFANNFAFDDEGFLVADGQRWNLETGLSVGIVPSLRVLPTYEEGDTQIEIVKRGGQTIVFDTGLQLEIAGLAVSDDYAWLALVASDKRITHRVSNVSLYFYSLQSGGLISVVPQQKTNLYQIFFQQSSSILYLVMSSPYGGGLETRVYQAQNGVEIAPVGITPPIYTINREIVSYVTEDNELFVRGFDGDTSIPREKQDFIDGLPTYAFSVHKKRLLYNQIVLKFGRCFQKVVERNSSTRCQF